MGTNFYVADYMAAGYDRMDPAIHIGRRSAAGLYCWDCRVTLCRFGEAAIHFAPPGLPPAALGRRYEPLWHDACPCCGARPDAERFDASAVGRELGFNCTPPHRKTGVASCSSFTWAMSPAALEGVAAIEDEYGRRYTRGAFLAMLEECPIQYFDSVGVWFA